MLYPEQIYQEFEGDTGTWVELRPARVEVADGLPSDQRRLRKKRLLVESAPSRRLHRVTAGTGAAREREGIPRRRVP